MSEVLTRRESLCADEPVMRDGKCLDIAIRALDATAGVQAGIIAAIASPNPDAWLREVESDASELLARIRSMRAVLK